MNQQIRPEVTADKAIAAAHKNWLNARGPVTVAHEKLARYSGLTAKTAKRRTAEELREAIAENNDETYQDFIETASTASGSRSPPRPLRPSRHTGKKKPTTPDGAGSSRSPGVTSTRRCTAVPATVAGR